MASLTCHVFDVTKQVRLERIVSSLLFKFVLWIFEDDGINVVFTNFAYMPELNFALEDCEISEWLHLAVVF